MYFEPSSEENSENRIPVQFPWFRSQWPAVECVPCSHAFYVVHSCRLNVYN